jgi:hypothetical protein
MVDEKLALTLSLCCVEGSNFHNRLYKIVASFNHRLRIQEIKATGALNLGSRNHLQRYLAFPLQMQQNSIPRVSHLPPDGLWPTRKTGPAEGLREDNSGGSKHL